MKKLTKIFLIGVMVFLIGGYFLFWYIFNQPCSPPTRPTNVPFSAHWFGGCDGGDWIELVSVKEKKYRFKIYRDWDGIVKLDAEFEIKGCNNLELNIANFTNVISYYNVGLDEEVRLEVSSGTDCYLAMISPAYGGEEWEIIKENHKH